MARSAEPRRDVFAGLKCRIPCRNIAQAIYCQKKEALKSGCGVVIETVFHNDREEPIARKSMRNIYKRICRELELRDFRFHDIQDTFASLLLSNGESPVYAIKQLGHSSIKMTVDIYGHLISGNSRQAVNQLDEIAPKPHPGKNKSRNQLRLQPIYLCGTEKKT